MRGRFHCPHCDLARAYAYRRVRSMFVFLYVPVLPLTGAQDFVQCCFCRRAFKPSVLESAGLDGTERLRDGEEGRPQNVEFEGAAASTLLVWEDGGSD